MQVSLHKCSRTTPAIRAELRAATGSDAELARRYNLSRMTVRKWRNRCDSADRPHIPHRLQTTLSPPQEAIVVALREALLLPLDDLLAVTRELIHAGATRSGIDRCLRRHGLSKLKDLRPKDDSATVPLKTFKAYAPGFMHIDVKYLPQMPEESQRTYCFVAIDRATRWVYAERLPDKSAASARGFLERLLKAAPFKILTLLTDNGKEFTDRFCATGERTATGRHPFDQVCLAPRHRAPPHQAPPSPNQRHGRALQRAHQRGLGHPPLSQRRAPRRHPHPLRQHLQSLHPPTRPGPSQSLRCPTRLVSKAPALFVVDVNQLPGPDTYMETREVWVHPPIHKPRVAGVIPWVERTGSHYLPNRSVRSMGDVCQRS